MQAVDTAVAAAVADARVKTKEEVEAASAAKKAAADQQLLRELEDKTEALTNQVNAATEQLRSTETALKSAPRALLLPCCCLSVALLSVMTRVCLPVSAYTSLCFHWCVPFVKSASVPSMGLCLLDLVSHLTGNKGVGSHVVSQRHYLADVQACFCAGWVISACDGNAGSHRRRRSCLRRSWSAQKRLELRRYQTCFIPS